jgi:hypothetical protein
MAEVPVSHALRLRANREIEVRRSASSSRVPTHAADSRGAHPAGVSCYPRLVQGRASCDAVQHTTAGRLTPNRAVVERSLVQGCIAVGGLADD